MVKVKTQSTKEFDVESGCLIVEENGEVSTLGRTGIHLFSEKMFTNSKAILCEKVLVDEKKVDESYSATLALSIILGLPGRDV